MSVCIITQSCLTLCDPLDCSPPGSSVHGILQARISGWVAYPFSSGSSQPRDWTQVFCIAGGFFTSWATREALIIVACCNIMCFVIQLCLTLCDPMDCSPPDPSVHGILQARILERVAMSSSRASFQPRDRTQVSCIAGRFFTIWATREVQVILYYAVIVSSGAIDMARNACLYIKWP